MPDVLSGGRTAPARPHRRGRLARYALYQLWDYCRERGFGIVIIGALVGYQIISVINRTGGGAANGIVMTAASTAVTQLASQFAPLFVLLSVSRIISADRTMGYFRLLFSKPVSVSGFYLQRFAVHLAGLLACVTALYALLWLGGVRLNVLPMLAYVTTLYVAMGGLGFMLSAVTRFDWPLLVGTWYASALLYALYGARGGVAGALVHALPPAHTTDAVRDALLGGTTLPATSLAWLLGYGAACALAGLVVLERRSLSQ